MQLFWALLNSFVNEFRALYDNSKVCKAIQSFVQLVMLWTTIQSFLKLFDSPWYSMHLGSSKKASWIELLASAIDIPSFCFCFMILMGFCILSISPLRCMLRITWSILINHNKWIVWTNPNTIDQNCFGRSCNCLRHHCPRFGSAWTRKASF